MAINNPFDELQGAQRSTPPPQSNPVAGRAPPGMRAGGFEQPVTDGFQAHMNAKYTPDYRGPDKPSMRDYAQYSSGQQPSSGYSAPNSQRFLSGAQGAPRQPSPIEEFFNDPNGPYQKQAIRLDDRDLAKEVAGYQTLNPGRLSLEDVKGVYKGDEKRFNNSPLGAYYAAAKQRGGDSAPGGVGGYDSFIKGNIQNVGLAAEKNLGPNELYARSVRAKQFGGEPNGAVVSASQLGAQYPRGMDGSPLDQVSRARAKDPSLPPIVLHNGGWTSPIAIQDSNGTMTTTGGAPQQKNLAQGVFDSRSADGLKQVGSMLKQNSLTPFPPPAGQPAQAGQPGYTNKWGIKDPVAAAKQDSFDATYNAAHPQSKNTMPGTNTPYPTALAPPRAPLPQPYAPGQSGSGYPAYGAQQSQPSSTIPQASGYGYGYGPAPQPNLGDHGGLVNGITGGRPLDQTTTTNGNTTTTSTKITPEEAAKFQNLLNGVGNGPNNIITPGGPQEAPVPTPDEAPGPRDAQNYTGPGPRDSGSAPTTPVRRFQPAPVAFSVRGGATQASARQRQLANTSYRMPGTRSSSATRGSGNDLTSSYKPFVPNKPFNPLS